VIDSEVREITVPDLTSPDTFFGTPALFRARTVRDVQQLKANRDALPTAAREFQRTERLVIRIPVYGPATAPPAVSARLLNRAGQAMSDVPVAAEPGAGALIEITLASLAAGEYVLEISAAGSETKELLGFRVTG
jgi:hypothetical protein